MISRLSILIILLNIILVVAGCGSKDQKPAGSQQRILAYKVFEVKPMTATVNNEYPATIEGKENVEIRPMIDGYIEKIFIDEGATVSKGQLLFRINAPQYEQEVRTAEANIKIAEANVNTVLMEVNKLKPLVEKNIISPFELEAANFNLESKKAALAQAQATLVNARTNIGYTNVRSPVKGVVGTLPLKAGSLVSRTMSTPMTTVSNITEVYAYFAINEKTALQFAGAANGRSPQEQLKALPPVTLVLSTGEEYPDKGRIEATSGLINIDTRSMQVRATFSNPNKILRSGSSGAIKIPVTYKDAILIPQKSTYEIQGKKFVYLLSDSATVHSIEIKFTETSDGRFFIVNEGLKQGDKVVFEGVATLREGAVIKPMDVRVDSLLAIQ